MLTEEEKEHGADETLDVADALEVAMLAAAARAAMDGAPVWKLRERLAELRGGASRRAAGAVSRDMEASFTLDAVREAQAAGAPVDGAVRRAMELAAEAASETLPDVEKMMAEMAWAAERGYHAVALQARAAAARAGEEKILSNAVTALARNGIDAYTYTRTVNGAAQTVRVPVDVGIRRAISNGGRERLAGHIFEIAEQTGNNLVAVSITANARESHAVWQGRVYQIEGAGKYPNLDASCHYNHVTGKPTDQVEGLHGFNCGHSIAIYREGMDFPFHDPLEGTGYTTEQARALVSKQRRLEAKVRAHKREAQVMEEVGLDPSTARRLTRETQAKLRKLVSEHPKVLQRQPWRERLYGRSRREVKFAMGKAPKRYASTVVPEGMIESAGFRARAAAAFGGSIADDHLASVQRALKHRSGTKMEDLYALNVTDGSVMSAVLDATEESEVVASDQMVVAVDAAVRRGDKVAFMHNHPSSTMPSAADVVSLSKSGAAFGVVACHDGSFFTYRVVGTPAPGYNINDETIDTIFGLWSKKGEAAAFIEIRERLGVEIVHHA